MVGVRKEPMEAERKAALGRNGFISPYQGVGTKSAYSNSTLEEIGRGRGCGKTEKQPQPQNPAIAMG